MDDASEANVAGANETPHHFQAEDVVDSPKPAAPFGRAGNVYTPTSAAGGGGGGGGGFDDDDDMDPDEPAVISFRGKKISALESYFRECATMHDIIQVYWDHSRLFHNIALPSTSDRECEASQKVKDLTREVFVIQGEQFDMHIFDGNGNPSQFGSQQLDDPGEVGGAYESDHVSAAMAAAAAQNDYMTECFRRVIARLNGAAQEEFSSAPHFGRKYVASSSARCSSKRSRT